MSKWNNRRVQRALLAGTALGALAGLAAPTLAMAAAPADSSQVQEIVVTAQRRSENIQQVPVSIQAFTAKTITDLGIKSLGRPRPGDAQRRHRHARRLRQPADHHHPRHRAERLRHQQRRPERHLCRRGLSQRAGVPDLPDLRPAADRGAEGPAGHPLRPQHQRRGDQLHHRQADRPARGRLPRRVQLVQHLQLRRRRSVGRSPRTSTPAPPWSSTTPTATCTTT